MVHRFGRQVLYLINLSFLAPEVYCKLDYSFPSDVWSFGIVMGEISCNAEQHEYRKTENNQAQSKKIQASLSTKEAQEFEKLASLSLVEMLEVADR